MICQILFTLFRLQCFKSLWHSDAIRRHMSWSTLTQVMACWLPAPICCQDQCWLIINDILLHSSEGNFTGNAQDSHLWNELENYWLKITTASRRNQPLYIYTYIYVCVCVNNDHASASHQIGSDDTFWWHGNSSDIEQDVETAINGQHVFESNWKIAWV